MKRFKFRLETVEKVRKRNEEEAMSALVEARRRLSELVAKGEALQSGLEQALVRREQLGSRPTGAGAFLVEDDFIAGNKLRIAQLAIQVQKAQRAVEKAQRFFLHARRQLHVIVTLREREYEAFKKEQQRLEQKRVDEMVTMRSGRMQQEESA
jgi:flagellar export protein FliJ